MIDSTFLSKIEDIHREEQRSSTSSDRRWRKLAFGRLTFQFCQLLPRVFFASRVLESVPASLTLDGFISDKGGNYPLDHTTHLIGG